LNYTLTDRKTELEFAIKDFLFNCEPAGKFYPKMTAHNGGQST